MPTQVTTPPLQLALGPRTVPPPVGPAQLRPPAVLRLLGKQNAGASILVDLPRPRATIESEFANKLARAAVGQDHLRASGVRDENLDRSREQDINGVGTVTLGDEQGVPREAPHHTAGSKGTDGGIANGE